MSEVPFSKGKEAEEFAHSIMNRILNCLENHSGQRKPDPLTLSQLLNLCFSDSKGKPIFILNGEENICDTPGAILVVPSCTKGKLMKALSRVNECYENGTPIDGVLFITDGNIEAARKEVDWFIRIAHKFELDFIALQFLRAVTQWYSA